MAAGGLLAGLAGCLGDGDADSPTPTATESPDLDLREANVVGVAVESVGDGEYRFDVTLYHDDEGEDGYANWWQVETRAGERLGRRELAHAHGTREFTRSATVAVPDDAWPVVVRGHDRTHGYGGRAALVGADGTVCPVEQGTDPADPDGWDCG
jgi:hypothetical protein